MMILKTQDLTKTYGQHIAVNHVNLEIEKGSFTAILGPNGAGKSSTIQMLIGLLQPDSGSVHYAQEIKIGVVFQNSVLDEMLTVKENLQIRACQYKQVASGKVEELIDQLGLTNFSHQQYGSLSGGQKRRVDIARALLNNPDILFLDEPTTGLDIQTREAIWDLLNLLQEKQKMTVVLTTHYLDEADSADQVYIVDHGQIIAQGTANQIKGKYAKNILKLQTGNIDPLLDYLRDDSLIEKVNEGEIILKPETAQSALDIINDCRDLIDNFEFRSGTMDDAFIALTGREVR
ncbi:ABC transporter ATP-binding protein [Streptococcus mutans]|jgi:putative ABC transporter, ATP-binding protein|uniref:ABC transporter, ATP-binding protein n=3 Tax=Streptococcus mutans TaxID=1309 RepID=Q8DVP3_STRMU|nr:putative ABC transporter, ATP-binding protein [Streptococcus mutans UA159]AJD54845.1 ABC transporter ATP-binding protein [Streptococcus mutans UA159-FR]EMB65178.1 putative ABC transporter, ATP-binding protein [Streptococcus mutans 4SM1]EMB78950.1 putative ABC transporter, ATP-binding protein [Streptococcus mutans NFSM2]EMB97834.1 putative ABC transporter, ATP-binding protein [Streptococcus mutans M21]EMC12256.1 putative ABC transporter, ATP-binding protein [Streptococcus mutans N66]EMC2509